MIHSIPSSSCDQSLSNTIVEWIENNRLKGGQLRKLEPATTRVLCMLFAGPLAAVDTGAQIGSLTAKLLIVGAGQFAHLMTCGQRGAFAQDITKVELLAHARKIALFFSAFLAHTLTTAIVIVSAAGFVAQMSHPVTLGIRVLTVALLALSSTAVHQLNDPDKLISRYRSQGMITGRHKYLLNQVKRSIQGRVHIIKGTFKAFWAYIPSGYSPKALWAKVDYVARYTWDIAKYATSGVLGRLQRYTWDLVAHSRFAQGALLLGYLAAAIRLQEGLTGPTLGAYKFAARYFHSLRSGVTI